MEIQQVSERMTESKIQSDKCISCGSRGMQTSEWNPQFQKAVKVCRNCGNKIIISLVEQSKYKPEYISTT